MASLELTLAIENGNSFEVKRLLDSGLSLTVEQVLIATSSKNITILETILSSGWDINTDVNDFVPSMLVYTFKDEELLNLFLRHGANPNKPCRIRDCTPLSYAVRDASFSVIKCLFEHRGQLEHGQLLHYASMRNEDNDGFEVLRFIYNLDPEYNRPRINELLDERSEHYLMNQRSGLCTPLQYAAINNSENMMQFLLAQGANPAHLDPYHRTAISYAIHNSHHKITGILKNWTGSVQS